MRWHPTQLRARPTHLRRLRELRNYKSCMYKHGTALYGTGGWDRPFEPAGSILVVA